VIIQAPSATRRRAVLRSADRAAICENEVGISLTEASLEALTQKLHLVAGGNP